MASARSTPEKLHDHHAKELRKVKRLLRQLHRELRWWMTWADDTPLDDMKDGGWDWKPTLGDVRFIAQMLEVYVQDHLKGTLGIYAKELEEHDKKRGVDGVNVVDIFDAKIARLQAAAPAEPTW